jgi:hypothetical protein
MIVAPILANVSSLAFIGPFLLNEGEYANNGTFSKDEI